MELSKNIYCPYQRYSNTIKVILFQNKSLITTTYLQCMMCLEELLAGKQDKGVRSGKHMNRLPDCNKIIGNVILDFFEDTKHCKSGRD